MVQKKPKVRDSLEPQQLGMSEAGAQKLIFSVRSGLNPHAQFIDVARQTVNEAMS